MPGQMGRNQEQAEADWPPSSMVGHSVYSFGIRKCLWTLARMHGGLDSRDSRQPNQRHGATRGAGSYLSL